MHPSIWALLPFAVVIPVSVLSRQVIPGLVAGLLVGAFLISPSPLGGVNTALSYLYKELQVSGNLHLVVFLYGFGALVGLLRVTGGVSGLAEWLGPKVRSARAAFGVAWLSTLGTFMAPDFRIITVAPILSPLMKRYEIDPERLAYVIDVTSTPLIALVPVGTAFVGYMVGLIAVSLKHVGSQAAPYPFFLKTIPLNFFAIAILLIGIYVSFFHRDVLGDKHKSETVGAGAVSGSRESELNAPKLRAARNALRVEASRELGHSASAQDDTDDTVPDPLEAVSARAVPNVLHLAGPIGLLIVLTLGLTWWDGHDHAPSFLGALVHADAAKAMLQAILITLIASVLFYLVRGQKMDRLMFGVVAGGNEMMPVIVLLALVWAVAGVSTALGFSQYVGQELGTLVPRAFIAPVVFVLGSVISYFIGSSFGTWGILLPLGFSLATAAHASLPLVAGAVFASGTLGGFASPLSDNTVAMATVMRLPVVGFARSLLKSSLVAGAVATIAYAGASFVF